MTLREDIISTIRNENHQALLISYVQTHKLRKVNTLKEHIDNAVQKTRKILAADRFKANHKRREKTKELEYFMQIKKLAGKL